VTGRKGRAPCKPARQGRHPSPGGDHGAGPALTARGVASVRGPSDHQRAAP
jgi:hypothetical protein